MAKAVGLNYPWETVDMVGVVLPRLRKPYWGLAGEAYIRQLIN